METIITACTALSYEDKQQLIAQLQELVYLDERKIEAEEFIKSEGHYFEYPENLPLPYDKVTIRIESSSRRKKSVRDYIRIDDSQHFDVWFNKIKEESVCDKFYVFDLVGKQPPLNVGAYLFSKIDKEYHIYKEVQDRSIKADDIVYNGSVYVYYKTFTRDEFCSMSDLFVPAFC